MRVMTELFSYSVLSKHCSVVQDRAKPLKEALEHFKNILAFDLTDLFRQVDRGITHETNHRCVGLP